MAVDDAALAHGRDPAGEGEVLTVARGRREQARVGLHSLRPGCEIGCQIELSTKERVPPRWLLAAPRRGSRRSFSEFCVGCISERVLHHSPPQLDGE